MTRPLVPQVVKYDSTTGAIGERNPHSVLANHLDSVANGVRSITSHPSFRHVAKTEIRNQVQAMIVDARKIRAGWTPNLGCACRNATMLYPGDDNDPLGPATTAIVVGCVAFVHETACRSSVRSWSKADMFEYYNAAESYLKRGGKTCVVVGLGYYLSLRQALRRQVGVVCELCLDVDREDYNHHLWASGAEIASRLFDDPTLHVCSGCAYYAKWRPDKKREPIEAAVARLLATPSYRARLASNRKKRPSLAARPVVRGHELLDRRRIGAHA